MARIIETATGTIDPTEVDPVTLDLIENSLRNARYEMDEVLFRTALSPGIREQHDEFPLIANRDGKMMVGQFGLSIPDFLDNFDGTIEEGDVLLTSDPYSCGAAISHAASGSDQAAKKTLCRSGLRYSGACWKVAHVATVAASARTGGRSGRHSASHASSASRNGSS